MASIIYIKCTGLGKIRCLKFCDYFYDVWFFCIDIVDSSKDTEIQNDNIKN